MEISNRLVIALSAHVISPVSDYGLFKVMKIDTCISIFNQYEIKHIPQNGCIKRKHQQIITIVINYYVS